MKKSHTTYQGRSTESFADATKKALQAAHKDHPELSQAEAIVEERNDEGHPEGAYFAIVRFPEY